MLGFVAIVTLIATTAAYIPEYTDDVKLELSAAYPESKVITAEVFNADSGLKFKTHYTFNGLGLGLIPDLGPDQSEAEAEEGCGKLFGIHLDNINKNFCKPTLFLLTFGKEEDSTVGEHHTYMRFSLYFNAKDQPPIKIDIPVYQIPFKHASADKKQLQEWATGKKVGISAPIKTLLTDITSNNEWTSNFEWLGELVSYGIFQNEASPITAESYTTRPVLISNDEVASILQVVEQRWRDNV